MRPIAKVIKAAITMIPDDFEKRADLMYELDEIVESAAYAAPEMTGMLWGRFIDTLDEHLGQPNGVKWKQDILELLSTRIDYRTVLGE